MNVATTKARLKGAQTGHSLLKRKADALNKRFRVIMSKIDEVGFSESFEFVCLVERRDGREEGWEDGGDVVLFGWSRSSWHLT